MKKYNSMEASISQYDQHYGFIENPDEFFPHLKEIFNYEVRYSRQFDHVE